MNTPSRTATLTIILERRSGNRWPVAVKSRSPESLTSDPVAGELALDLEELGATRTTRGYGICLGKALFAGEVENLFLEALRSAGDPPLRVLLEVRDEELRQLHWQRLCAPLPGGWRHLALDLLTPFSLSLPGRARRRFPPIGSRALKALIVVANPPGVEDYGLERLSDEQESTAVEGLREALGEERSDVLAGVPGAGGPTLEELCDRLTRGDSQGDRYTLLHILAHGKLRRDTGETALCLAPSKPGEPPLVAADVLLERLEGLGNRLPYFVFLAACDSAAPEAEGRMGEAEKAAGGLAQRLVRDVGLPAVLAMSDEVTLRTVNDLAKVFYPRLGKHGEIDRALGEATKGLRERFEVMVPTLFSRLEGRPLYSDSLDRELDRGDVAYGLEVLLPLIEERAPMVEDFDAPVAELERTLETDPAALSPAARAGRDAALAKLDGLCDEVLELTFHALALGGVPPSYQERCPFPGDPPPEGAPPFDPGPLDTPAERRQAVERIERQAGDVGLELEPELADSVVDDVAGEPAATELLAATLHQLWRHRRGRRLCHEEYRAARQAVAAAAVGRAEKLWQGVSPLEQRRLRDIFLRLVSLDEDDRSAGERRETRRRVALAELVPVGSPESATRGLVRRLADERLVVTAAGEDGGEEVVLAEEALIREWPRLAQWLAADRELLRLREAVRSAAREWRLGSPPEHRSRLLHRGSRLDAVEERVRQGRLDLNAGEQKYLGACIGRRRRGTRYLAALAVLLLVLAAVAVIGWNAAWRHAGDAEAERQISLARQLAAERQRTIGLMQRLAAESLTERDQRPDLALLLSLHALRIAESDRFAESVPQIPFTVRRSLLGALTRRPSLVGYQWGHQDIVRAIAWSPDGKRLASAGYDRKVLLWDVFETIILRRDFEPPGHQNWVNSVAWSPDSRVLASGSGDGAVILWDVENGDRLAKLPPFDQPVTSLAFQPPGDPPPAERGEVLAVGSGSSFCLWTRSTGCQRTLEGHGGDVESGVFSPDGRRFVSGAQDGRVILWDAATGEKIDEHSEHDGIVYSVAFTPTGEPWVASGGADGAVILWNIESGERRSVAGRHDSWVFAVAWSADGRMLASGSRDTTVRLWQADTGEAVGRPLSGHSGGMVRSLAFPHREAAAWGGLLFSGGEDGRIIGWEVSDLQEIGTDPGLLGRRTFNEGSAYEAIRYRPEDSCTPEAERNTVAGVDEDHRVFLSRWEWGSDRQLLEDDPSRFYRLAWSPDRQTLALGDLDGRILLWDAASTELSELPREPATDAPRHQKGIQGLAWHPDPDRRQLVSAGDDGRLIVWHVDSGEVEILWGPDPPISGSGRSMTNVAWSGDGRWIAIADQDGDIGLWDRQSQGGPFPIFGPTGTVRALAFDPHSRKLAAGGFDLSVMVWDVHRSSDPPQKLFVGHVETVYSLAWSPDGRVLASAGDGRSVILWDVEAGQRVGRLSSGHRATVTSLDWSPDGRTLASASRDGSFIFWDVSLEGWKDGACRIVDRQLTREEWIHFAGSTAGYEPVCLPSAAD